MRVLVTGGNGRVGRHVVSELARLAPASAPHEIIVFDRAKRRVPRGVTQVAGDHANLDELLAAFAGVDAVLHLSALQATAESRQEVLSANTQGTMNVFEAAQRCGVKKVINWSSVWALGWTKPGNTFIPDYLPIDENHPLRADDPYGRSKIEGEEIAQAHHGQDGLEVTTLRSVYTALPATMAMLSRTNGIKDPIYSHLAYVDVFDHARAARLAIETKADGYRVVYLAADDSRVAEPLAELLPKLHAPIGDRAAQLTGSRSSISNQRAKELLGWSPQNSWRRMTLRQRARGYVAAGSHRAVATVLPTEARERLRSRFQ